MIFWVYNVLLVFLAPLWVPWMIWRASKRREKPDWKQRSGHLPIKPAVKGVRRAWIHAVSVGEFMAVLPVLGEIRRLDPALEIVLSTTTSTGQQAARDRAKGLFDHLVYFPIDVLRFDVAALARVRPNVVAVMETELWFNFFWASNQFRAKNLVINGRLSDKSQSRAWILRPYYRALAALVDKVLAQSEGDAARFRALGFAGVECVGNTKFDAASQEASDVKDWKGELGIPFDAKVVVVGSTRELVEDGFVIYGLKTAGLLDDPTVWIVHAPRHVENAPSIAEAYSVVGVDSVTLRSKVESGRVLVLDTFGELGGIYSIATVAVVGGGFGNSGGQNLLQPLAHGVPVIHGRHMHNFKEISKGALDAGASVVVRSQDELAGALKRIVFDQTVRDQMSAGARAYMASQGGAALRCAEAIVEAANAEGQGSGV